VKTLCRIAKVSRKCFYSYLERLTLPDPYQQARNRIIEIQTNSGRSLGYRPVTALLRRERIIINHKKVSSLMKEEGLLSKVRKKKHPKNYYVQKKEQAALLPKNILNRDFSVSHPYTNFVEDITYIPCIGGFIYLNAIEDLFNSEIVAYQMARHPDALLCTDTVKELAAITNLTGALIHSDQGATYTSHDYKNLLLDLHVVQSMSRRGDCYDNACIESFFAILKSEAFYCRYGKTNVKNGRISAIEMIKRVDDFILYYNNTRIKSKLGWLSPVEYRNANPLGTLPAIRLSSQLTSLPMVL